MPEFVRDNVGLGKIAGCFEFVFQFAEKCEIEIEFPVARTIKRFTIADCAKPHAEET